MAEAAGIILGAFSLLIEALDAYMKGIETMRKWRNWHKTLQRTVRTLKMEWLKYHNNLTLLLSNFTSPDDLEQLLANPQGKE